MIFPPKRTALLLIHFAATLLLLAAVGVSAHRILLFPPDAIGSLAILLAAACLLALPLFFPRIHLLLTANYTVHSEGYLSIRFGLRRERFSLEQIEEIRSGGKIPAELRAAAPGWGKAWQSDTLVEDSLPTAWIASDSGSNLLLLMLKDRAIAVSPDQPAAFINAVQEISSHALFSSTHPLSEIKEPLLSGVLAHPPALGLLSSSLAANVLLLAFVFGILPSLPQDQIFKFDPFGLPSSPGNPIRLLLLPVTNLMVWLINTILGWLAWKMLNHQAAYILWSASLITGIGFWFAVMILILYR